MGMRNPELDSVLQDFLEVAEEDAARVNEDSDILELVPNRNQPGPPSSYAGRFTNIEHLRWTQDGVRRSREPIDFSLSFPPDYLRDLRSDLQFKVARLLTPVHHPNISKINPGMVCLGGDFACGTRLKPLIEQLYLILSCRIAATEDAFDRSARDYFLANVEAVSSLNSARLWRRSIAASVSVRTHRGGAAETTR